jgi:hypothetical protein
MRFLSALTIVSILAVGTGCQAPADTGHPSIFNTASEAAELRSNLGNYPLLDRSVEKARGVMATALAAPIETPPPGEAGGYAHERHKQNYREMFAAGLLFQITGEEQYAGFVRDMLDAYADIYPDLPPHPLAYNQRAGKLFHQTLNEQVWLVHTAVAYDNVYDWLSEEQRARYEANIFRPMAEWFSVRNEAVFNRIHNHGTWAVAAVGMIGYVMGEDHYVQQALHGSQLDGEGGFLAQLDLLFSPDGYYMEGPYYIRYAMMPFFFFAEAVERNSPEVGIYKHRDGILEKALFSLLQTSFPDGVFPPINDASRSMGVSAPEVVLAADLAFTRFGSDPNLLGVAGIQNEVVLNGSGLEVARAYAQSTSEPVMDFPSVEFTDGPNGDRGGLGILRTGRGQDATMLVMKYGVHGSGHGHFDKLHFMLYDQGREVIPDYGFSRWVNIEPKYGGRYLPENDSYAMQTIAHNTVVVDETTQNGFVERDAEALSGLRHFADLSNPDVQVVSALANGYWDGVDMQRTLFLVNDDRLEHPVTFDLYKITSEERHQYDLSTHFRGQVIATDQDIQAFATRQEPLGDDYGYEHIWKTGQAATTEPMRLTWLDGSRYYSVLSAPTPGGQLILGRTGANDPSYNLFSEPLAILRTEASDHLFASVIQPHGFFSEALERSTNARGDFASVEVLLSNDEMSVVRFVAKAGWSVVAGTTHGAADSEASHSVVIAGETFDWTGNYFVSGVQLPGHNQQ